MHHISLQIFKSAVDFVGDSLWFESFFENEQLGFPISSKILQQFQIYNLFLFVIFDRGLSFLIKLFELFVALDISDSK